MLHKQQTALLIEADSLVLADLEDALCNAGFRCVAFPHATEADPSSLRMANSIALAVLDWTAGSMHVAEQLLDAGVPVILTTAGEAEAPPGAAVLRKPYLSSQLQDLIASVMAERGRLNA